MRIIKQKDWPKFETKKVDILAVKRLLNLSDYEVTKVWDKSEKISQELAGTSSPTIPKVSYMKQAYGKRIAEDDDEDDPFANHDPDMDLIIRYH